VKEKNNIVGSVHYLKNLELNFVILSTSYLSLNFYLAGNNNFKILAKKIFSTSLVFRLYNFAEYEKNICMYALSNYYTIYPCFYMSFIYKYNICNYIINVSEVLYPPISYPSPLYPLCKTQLKSTNVCLNVSWLFDKEYFTAKIISIQKNNLSPIKKNWISINCGILLCFMAILWMKKKHNCDSSWLKMKIKKHKYETRPKIFHHNQHR